MQLDGLPIICGGSNEKIHCIAKDQSKFLVQRKDAASVVLSNNILWVTGGYDHISKDGKTCQGPDLPLPLQNHSIVPLNSGALLPSSSLEDIVETPQQSISMRRKRVGGQVPTSRMEDGFILLEC